jgi:transcriptional regulator with XRE-family HTH domain
MHEAHGRIGRSVEWTCPRAAIFPGLNLVGKGDGRPMVMATAGRSARQKLLDDRQTGGIVPQSTRLAQPTPGRAADAIDLHVGSRIRLARKALDMTQEALAGQLGITFQQLQKYEKGINRISASRLHHAARVLGVPVGFFFPAAEPAEPSEAGVTRTAMAETMDVLSTIDGIELSRAFAKIEDAAVRKRVLDLVRSIALSSGEGQQP